MKTTFNINLLFPIIALGILLGIDFYVISMPVWLIILLTVTAYPMRIGDDLLSLWGGINHKGGVYSLFGIYQVANHDAISVTGILVYQRAGEVAGQWLGIAFIQHSLEDRAYQGFGISFYQKSNGFESGKEELEVICGQLIGIAFYHSAEKETLQFLGVTIYRQARKFVGWGIPIFQSKIN